MRDNRFYHADMGITIAFPRGWTIDNLRDRLLAFTPKKDAVMQVMIDAKPDKQAPREFLLSKLKGASMFKGEAITTARWRGLHRRDAQRLTDRQRAGSGALGRGVSRPERFRLRWRESFRAGRRAGGRRAHQVDMS